MKKTNKNLWRIMWIIGVYATLISILYLVVLYKVKWEDRDLNKYLYFYNCSGNLCTTDQKPEEYYNKVLCQNDNCPYIIETKDDLVILKNNDNTNYIYNYMSDKIINDQYIEYHFLTDYNYLIVTKDNLQGIIDYNNEIIIPFKYTQIKDYKNDYFVYKENEKYGISKKDNEIIAAEYNDICLINSLLYAYNDDNSYYISSYNSKTPISNSVYDYIYSTNNIIFTVIDKQIDILDENLKSKLVMKIDTYYSYTTEKERSSLNFKVDKDLLYFTIYTGNNKYDNYIYDINNGKLYK